MRAIFMVWGLLMAVPGIILLNLDGVNLWHGFLIILSISFGAIWLSVVDERALRRAED